MTLVLLYFTPIKFALLTSSSCFSDDQGLNLDGIGLKSTLREVKDKIRLIKKRIGPVYIYWHGGSEIRYNESSTTLEDIFGSPEAIGADGDDGTDANFVIELDFAWPKAGPVLIICKGVAGEVRVLKNEESIVSIQSNAESPVKVELKRAKAPVSVKNAGHSK